MKWQKKLTNKELAHFKYATHGNMTLLGFKNVRQEQRKLDPNQEVCYECRSIALKLGLES